MHKLLYNAIKLCLPHCIVAITVPLSSTGAETPYGYDAEYYSEADEG